MRQCSQLNSMESAVQKNSLFKVITILLITVGCSSLSNKYEDASPTKRNPASKRDANFSYIETINSVSLRGITRRALKKDDEELLKAKARMDLIFQFAREEPLAFFAELRSKSPVFKSNAGGTGEGWISWWTESKVPNIYVVTSNKLVQEVLNNNETFTVKTYTDSMDKTVGPFMLGHETTADNPDKEGHVIDFNIEKHAMRHLIYESSNDLEKVKEITRKTVKDALLSTTQRPNQINVVTRITRDVPINVVREYFGFEAPVDDMKRWSRAAQHSFFHNPTRDEKINKKSFEAGKEMKAFLETFIPQIKRAIAGNYAKNTTVTQMIKASEAHAKHGLDETRLAANIMGLLIGAVETGSAAIVQSLNFFFDNPYIMERAVAAAKANDDELLSKMVWEALRFNPVNPWVGRYSVEDFTLSDGTFIEKGSLVLAATESAMFDESVFKNPYRFSTERKQEDYFHLGFARHRCLGDDVAMAFVPETIKQLILLPHLRRMNAGENPKFEHFNGKMSPFPESWNLVWGDASALPGEDAGRVENWKSKRWVTKTLKYVDGRIWDAREEYGTDIKNIAEKLFSDDINVKEDGVAEFGRIAKLTLDENKTPGELFEACMDINKLSHSVFPDIDQRADYCKVRIDFRICYALAAKVIEKSTEDSYRFCADEKGFLTEAEKELFKKNFNNHPSFSFLAE